MPPPNASRACTTAWSKPRSPLRGLFVTGTDTEVGKTVVAASVCAALAARGERVAAFKPVVTGLDEEPGEWPRDHELLARVASAGQTPDQVAPLTFGPPVSPHYAAEQAGRGIEPLELAAAARAAAEGADALICEGVGGLLVPLTAGYLIRDLALDLDLPLLVAARPGLGTINHTLLTLEAARAAGLEVAAVVFTPWPAEPSGMERSNRETIETLGDVRVCELPATTPRELAVAGAGLPLDDLLA
ncbi:MAG: dethiobiotin synthetase [Thermoleophilaceae bacterium]|nr:dethiobiotin synthetase [Thermoleophilaceae bacterium]